MKNRVVIDAPAKINLYLEITGKRPDGYHRLDTVMQAVSLSDLLVIGRTGESGIRVTCSRPGVPEDERNLAYKAARLILSTMNIGRFGLHIHIDKRTPSGAGLGGGSADGAAVLAGLARLLDVPLSLSQLQAMALHLGTDIPFTLVGGCARATGVGEQLTEAPCLPSCHIVIAKPPVCQDTAEAYALFDKHRSTSAPGVEPMLSALSAGDLPGVARAMHNDFFTAFLSAAHPLAATVEAIRAAMLSRGALGASMTGSGSAVAGLFPSGDKAQACAAALAGVEAFVCAPRSDGPKIVYED